jgi:hypothetical protein
MKNYKTEEDLLKEYSDMSKEDLVAILVAQDLRKIRDAQTLDNIDLSSNTVFPSPSKVYIQEYVHDNRLLGCYGNILTKKENQFFNSIDADPSRVPMIP